MSVDNIWYGDDTRDGLYRTDGDGLNDTEIIGSITSPVIGDVDIVGGKIYYSDWIANTINRCDLDGSNSEVLVTSEDSTRDVLVDAINSKIYYGGGGSSDKRIAKADLDGGNWTEVMTGFNIAGFALDVAGDWMYFLNFTASPDKISKAHLDGTGATDLLTLDAGRDFGLSLRIDLVNSKMYWSSWSATSTIERANLDGTEVEVLLTTEVDGYTYLALDVPGGKMYYINWVGMATPALIRANLDGTDPETLWSNAGSSPQGLILTGLSGGGPTAVQGRWDKGIYLLGRTTRRAR